MSGHNVTLSVAVDGDGQPVRSQRVTVASLQSMVFAARNAKHLTVTALATATGMSPRTIRDIEGGVQRSYRSTTLSPLDTYYGWEPNTAYETWRAGEGAGAKPDVVEVAAKVAEIAEEIRRMQKRPQWYDEVVNEFTLLSTDDRAILLTLARRLNRAV